MTAPIVVRHGVRETSFTVEDGALRCVGIVDRNRSGETRFSPPEAWVSPEAVREAEAQVAAVTEPRRRKAR